MRLNDGQQCVPMRDLAIWQIFAFTGRVFL
jgi:hypothetical protein